jgi:hypothetical protein
MMHASHSCELFPLVSLTLNQDAINAALVLSRPTLAVVHMVVAVAAAAMEGAATIMVGE